MTPTPPTRAWYVRPGVVLPLVSLLMFLVAISTPEYVVGRAGDPRPTITNRGPLGAKIFAELARAQGWRVERRQTSRVAAAPATVHVLLAPSDPVRKDEAHQVLESVRAGAGLLLVLDQQGPFEDSLHVAIAPGGATLTADPGTIEGCPPRRVLLEESIWPDANAHMQLARFRGAPPDGVVRLDRGVLPDSSTARVAIGFPYGRGRVVIVSDPDMIRNDAIRICRFGLDVVASTVLDYLAPMADGTTRTTLDVDEFHHGAGERVGWLDTFGALLWRTRPGRVVLVAMVAGVLFLLAAMPRDVPPRDDLVIERRSPKEQVDALARAYAQVAGTRTATARLLRGVRRRTTRGGGARRDARSDPDFLARVAATIPARAADIALVERALVQKLPARELLNVAQALQRIEDSLTQH